MSKKDLIFWFEQILDISEKIIDQVEPKDLNETYIYSYASSVLQYSNAIKNSVSSHDLIAIPAIFKSLLEAHIDFLNLCNYSNYHHFLYANYLWHRIQMLEATFKSPDNPFFIDTIDQIEDIGQAINKLRNELEATEQNIRNLDGNFKNVKTKFDLAGLEEVYTGVYKVINLDSHNDLLRIESRHLPFSNSGINLSTKTSWKVPEVASHLITTASINKMTIIKIVDVFKLNDLKSRIDKIEHYEKKIKSYLL